MPKQEDQRPTLQRGAPPRPRDLTDISSAVLRSEQAKRWTKRYRTEVAASSSSLLSTFAAVRHPVLQAITSTLEVLIASSILWTRSRPACKRTPASPYLPAHH